MIEQIQMARGPKKPESARIGADHPPRWYPLECIHGYDCCPICVYEHQRQEGGFHYCPNGHGWGWSKENCEREKLRRERDRLKQETARLEDARREAVEAANRETARADKAEKKVKGLTKRAAAGTCPCCQRTFANMATHMKRQHPEFVADTGANVVPIKAA